MRGAGVRTLGWEEVDDILLGATVMGCGGGGELAEGRELLRRVYEDGRAVTLAAPDDLAADALVACPYGVGGLTVGDESCYEGLPWAADHPGVIAVRALGEHVGREFAALITGELGGTSIADAFVPAAVLGLPIVDADPVGRAVPELEQSMFYVHDVPIAPLAVVNEIGDTVIVTRVADDHRAEALVRSLALASRNLVWVADHARPWAELREVVIPRAISGARAVGAALRTARDTGADAAAAVAAATGGGILFRGRVSSCEWEERGGFTWGETRIAGVEGDAGCVFRIWFKNENLMAWRDDVPSITAPDLIAVLDGSGDPVTNPHAAPGHEATVIGIPASPQWNHERAVATLGPRHFGFDLEHTPFRLPD